MARINSATIHGLNKGMDPCAVNSFDYIHELVNGLVKPHIQQRDLKRLRWSTKNKVELIIGKAVAPPERQREPGPGISEQSRGFSLFFNGRRYYFPGRRIPSAPLPTPMRRR